MWNSVCRNILAVCGSFHFFYFRIRNIWHWRVCNCFLIGCFSCNDQHQMKKLKLTNRSFRVFRHISEWQKDSDYVMGNLFIWIWESITCFLNKVVHQSYCYFCHDIISVLDTVPYNTWHINQLKKYQLFAEDSGLGKQIVFTSEQKIGCVYLHRFT